MPWGGHPGRPKSSLKVLPRSSTIPQDEGFPSATNTSLIQTREDTFKIHIIDGRQSTDTRRDAAVTGIIETLMLRRGLSVPPRKVPAVSRRHTFESKDAPISTEN
jgi:hypothetical protein